MKNFFKRYTIFPVLLVLLLAVIVSGLACEEEKEQPPAPAPVSGMPISSTLVPNTDFEVFLYIEQESPTVVKGDIIGTGSDIAVESMSVWGVPEEDSFTFGGGLTLASADDAARIHNQIASESKIWTLLSDRTIYFVQGSGAAAEALKRAISNNDFKYYDNEEALAEVSMFPFGGETKLAAVAIATPSKTLVNLVAKSANPEASGLLDVLLASANLQVITAGLYAPKQIDINQIAQATDLTGILGSDVGILALIKSGWPGIVVSPIVGRALESAGYVKKDMGGLNVYKGYLDAGNGQTVPLVLRVEGNRVFAAISASESYAETLILSVNI